MVTVTRGTARVAVLHTTGRTLTLRLLPGAYGLTTVTEGRRHHQHLAAQGGTTLTVVLHV